MEGSQLDDVVVFQTPILHVADSEEDYCVHLAARILGQILEHVSGLVHSEVCLDDSWASADVGHAPVVNVSIVWVNETPTHIVWALQFAERRGCLSVFVRPRRMSASERAVREAVFAAAQRADELTDARWIDAAEFQRIY